MITFTEILSCGGTVIYQVEGSHLTFFSSGTLTALLAYDGMLLLKLNQFEYGVNPGQLVEYDKNDPQFAMILYLQKYPQGKWIVKVNQQTDQLFSCLSQKTHFVDKNREKHKEFNKGEKEEKMVSKKREVVLERQEEEIKEEKEKQEQGVLVGASKQLSKGLKYTGGLFSRGIESFGGFIASKVSRKEETEVKDSTKENLKLAKNTTRNVLEFTSEQVGNLFRFGKKVAGDVGERFEKSEKGKELQENSYYDKVKQGTKTGVGVLANIYEGVEVAKGASKVVGARYGEEAGQAADGVFEGAGNVAKVMRVPADQTAKALK